MAGMLPGVECARRRRLGGLGDTQCGSRRSTFCLYTSNHDKHLNNSVQRSATGQSFQTEKLGNIAREAKERLDERLRNTKKPKIKRHNSTGNIRTEDAFIDVNLESVILGGLQKEIYSSKRSSRRFSWAKLGWKASDQEDCAVCLENFKPGDILVHLSCAHRFHSRCLVPWIEANSHCPYCRTAICS